MKQSSFRFRSASSTDIFCKNCQPDLHYIHQSVCSFVFCSVKSLMVYLIKLVPVCCVTRLSLSEKLPHRSTVKSSLLWPISTFLVGWLPLVAVVIIQPITEEVRQSVRRDNIRRGRRGRFRFRWNKHRTSTQESAVRGQCECKNQRWVKSRAKYVT